MMETVVGIVLLAVLIALAIWASGGGGSGRGGGDNRDRAWRDGGSLF